jgi:hypothetical protein
MCALETRPASGTGFALYSQATQACGGISCIGEHGGRCGSSSAYSVSLSWCRRAALLCCPLKVRQEAARTITLEQLRASPEACIGRMVIVGGDILRTTNVPGVTALEVLQKSLNSADRPLETDRSEGRFMVRLLGKVLPASHLSAGAVCR